MAASSTALLCLSFLFLPLCLAEIKNLAFHSDLRPLILFEKFGFTRRGFVNISVSLASLSYPDSSDPSSDPSSLGFLLATDDDLVQVFLEYRKPDSCWLRNPIVHLLFTLKDVDDNGTFSRLYPISDANEYGLYFANCARQVAVSMKVRTEMFNYEGSADRKGYLPAGQTQLPMMYLTFFFVYVGLTCVWMYLCWRRKASMHMIHVLMGALVFIKALDLICEAEDEYFIKSTGTPHGWDIAFYFFSFLKGVMLFVVIVLIGTGWSFLKPFLQDKDKKILMVVIPLQVFANIANVVIDETGPFAKDWTTWKQLLILVDIVCCCAVLFPIMWSIRDLKKASQTDGKAARTLVKLTLFRQYYIVLFVYIYFTRVVVYALTTVTVYKYRWVSDCAAELASLSFYVFTGYKFSPTEQNPYLAVDDDEEEAAAKEALRHDDFEL